MQFDSAVECTPWSFLRNFDHLTPRWDAHRGAWLCGEMHTSESDYCSSNMSVFFMFSYLKCLLTPFFRKPSEVKKISWPIHDLQYYFHNNIFHREIAFVKLQIKTDTWSQWYEIHTLRYDAHRGARLLGEMHTAELFRDEMHTAEFFKNFWSLDSAVWCTPRSLTPQWDAHRGAWLRSMK